MTTYKVLLVDDEEEVTNMIEERIDWAGLGFEVAGKAQNGVKALELSEKVQPDVVITDIKMPYMNGLELARYMKQENPGVRILILTGFDEFEYAKEAVHLEIEEYMLKPINSQELSECLKRLKKTLDNEREEKLNVKKLEHYFNASLPMFQTNLFISLIEGRITEADCEKFLAAYQIHMTGPLFGCAVFHTSEHHVPEGMNALLLSMSVEQEIRERIAEKWKSQMFTYLGNTVLVMELNSEEEAVAFTDDCDRFCRWAYRVMGAVVTAGIATVCLRSTSRMQEREKRCLTGCCTGHRGRSTLVRSLRQSRRSRFSPRIPRCMLYSRRSTLEAGKRSRRQLRVRSKSCTGMRRQ